MDAVKPPGKGGYPKLFTFFSTQTYYALAPKGLKMLM